MENRNSQVTNSGVGDTEQEGRTDPELLPCPFCGGPASMEFPDFYVQCDNDDCWIDVELAYPHSTAQDAARAWNKRAEDGQPAKNKPKQEGKTVPSPWVRNGQVVDDARCIPTCELLEENEWLEAMNAELLAALREATEHIEEWGAYASSYFQEKHNLAGDIAKHRATIAKAREVN